MLSLNEMLSPNDHLRATKTPLDLVVMQLRCDCLKSHDFAHDSPSAGNSFVALGIKSYLFVGMCA